jgi:predicted transcriptional regulator
MPRRRSDEVPEAIAQLQGRLDQWRSAQKGRTKLPESFWLAAVDLAKQYGVFRTAHTLRLDYMRLKRRLGDLAPARQKPPHTAFVELVTHATDRQECVIEFESAGQAKMRIQWKSSVPPDWKELLRAWREVEG